jgi:hypothetical protein
MPLAQHQMTQEQQIAVAQALAEWLEERYDREGDGPFVDPILAGTLRTSRSGAPWACFSPNPDQPGARWFRLTDLAPLPDEGYLGASAVLNDDDLPLGNSEGPLVIHLIRGRWLAQIINTGWNQTNEIIWE